MPWRSASGETSPAAPVSKSFDRASSCRRRRGRCRASSTFRSRRRVSRPLAAERCERPDRFAPPDWCETAGCLRSARILAVASSGSQRRDAGVQDVEPPRTVARQAADHVGGHVARGCERRARSSRGIREMQDRSGRSAVGATTTSEASMTRLVRYSASVRSLRSFRCGPCSLAAAPSGSDDDRVGTEDAFRLGPCRDLRALRLAPACPASVARPARLVSSLPTRVRARCSRVACRYPLGLRIRLRSELESRNCTLNR